VFYQNLRRNKDIYCIPCKALKIFCVSCNITFRKKVERAEKVFILEKVYFGKNVCMNISSYSIKNTPESFSIGE
jgi:hypothetical protein